MTVGERLRNLRRGKRLTLQELSLQIGYSISHISDIERGRDSPSLAICLSIAKYYKMDLASLFFGVTSVKN